jgi:hypothetical protein
VDPIKFFKYPSTSGQKQYEALRAYYIDHVPGKEVARRYGYTYAAFNSLKQKFKADQLHFFYTPPPGPKGPRVTSETRDKVIDFRKKNLSAYQIAEVLDTLGEKISVSSVDRILDQEGFPKLARRTQLRVGITKDNTIVPENAKTLKSEQMDGMEMPCSVGGIFLFAPLIEHFKIPTLIRMTKLPGSPKISGFSYFMSLLALKLMGKERLSQIDDFNFDAGLGLFAQCNYLPKKTMISSYSYRLTDKVIKEFMAGFVERQNTMRTYGNGTINLDFHTIQHYGDESVLQEHWAGSRNKRVKGALAMIAQDCDSRCQVYVNADITRSEADDEILAFVKFWKQIKGKFKNTLVFDSKLTTYQNLCELDSDGVKFITLRRRGKNLVKELENIDEDQWKKITIDSPRRKYNRPRVHDSLVHLNDYGKIRQVVMTDNGHEEPAFFITNDLKASVESVIERYAKRWNVENVIEEAVSFFNLNALSSPILIKVYFDVVTTMVADTLYYHLAKSLRGFEQCDAAKIFRHFIDMPAKISVQGDEVKVKYPLRAHTPVLRAAGLDKWIPRISWLGNRKLTFEWETGKI